MVTLAQATGGDIEVPAELENRPSLLHVEKRLDQLLRQSSDDLRRRQRARRQ
jgi:hypothetical protein